MSAAVDVMKKRKRAERDQPRERRLFEKVVERAESWIMAFDRKL